MIEVGNLARLLNSVSVKAEAQRAPAPAFQKQFSLDLRRGFRSVTRHGLVLTLASNY